MHFLYNIGILLYGLIIRIAAIGIPKARAWVNGRKGWQRDLQGAIPNDRVVVWFHCASLGEFEQGRPVLEAVKQQNPEYFMLLTFFSPSGYRIKGEYDHADHIAYLPLDTPANARRFIGIVRPSLVCFVKYEFWVNHLEACFDQEIPVILISAVFRPGQSYFKQSGKLILDTIRNFAAIFVQNRASQELLEARGIESYVSGDTRIDRVIEVSKAPKNLPFIQSFCDRPTLIFGSIWPQDEPTFVDFIRHNKDRYKCIIAPHEVDRSSVDRYLSRFEPRAIKYSRKVHFEPEKHDILVIDRIGILKHIYQYAHIVYIGGAFGHGLHNILEPTAFQKPVIFGPNYQKFPEAVELLEAGGAISVLNAESFDAAVQEIEATYKSKQEALITFYDKHNGATQRVLDFLTKRNLLP